jgi:hypothetical protein
MGKILIIIGAILIIIGIIIHFFDGMPWIGRLPGDISFRRGNFSFHFPLATSILISLILTLIFYLINKYK